MRHRDTSDDVAVPSGRPEHYPWVRTPGAWLRHSEISLAVVTDSHAWSVTSSTCGTASGQAPTHTDAVNIARAVLQLWREYPTALTAIDDHPDDIWARSAAPAAVDGM